MAKHFLSMINPSIYNKPPMINPSIYNKPIGQEWVFPMYVYNLLPTFSAFELTGMFTPPTYLTYPTAQTLKSFLNDFRIVKFGM